MVLRHCRDNVRRAIKGSVAAVARSFVDLMEDVVATAWQASEIRIVLDNPPAHNTKAVEEFLSAHPKVSFHFTPPILPG